MYFLLIDINTVMQFVYVVQCCKAIMCLSFWHIEGLIRLFSRWMLQHTWLIYIYFFLFSLWQWKKGICYLISKETLKQIDRITVSVGITLTHPSLLFHSGPESHRLLCQEWTQPAGTEQFKHVLSFAYCRGIWGIESMW